MRVRIGLTVQPKTTIVAENLYTTDAGVEQALNGMYILLKTSVYNPSGIMGRSWFCGDFSRNMDECRK